MKKTTFQQLPSQDPYFRAPDPLEKILGAKRVPKGLPRGGSTKSLFRVFLVRFCTLGLWGAQMVPQNPQETLPGPF